MLHKVLHLRWALCLPRSDVILLKNTEGVIVSNKRHNDRLCKFSTNGHNYSRILGYAFQCVSASTVDDSTLLPYSIRVGFERSTKKSRIYIYIVITGEGIKTGYTKVIKIEDGLQIS
jgi:hypothetical protein